MINTIKILNQNSMLKKMLCKAVALLFGCIPFAGAVAQQYNWDTPPYAEDYAFITNDGAWCWFSDPRAIYVNNKMIGGFVDKEGSNLCNGDNPI